MAAPLLEKSKATITVSNTVITVSIPLRLFPRVNKRDNVAYEHAIAFAPTKYLIHPSIHQICVNFFSIHDFILECLLKERERYKIMKILKYNK